MSNLSSLTRIESMDNDIRHEIAENEHHCHDEDATLDHRNVTSENRVVELQTNARPVENYLGEYRAAEQISDLKATDIGKDWQHVPYAML
jgi:hypothetical protein